MSAASEFSVRAKSSPNSVVDAGAINAFTTSRALDVASVSKPMRSGVFTALTALVLFVSGCADSSESDATTGADNVTSGEATSDAGVSMEGVDEQVQEAIAEMAPEDQKLVLAQKMCPVGGELGHMGTPIKVMVEDKPVFICCEGCRGPLLKDPEKWLAELKEKQAEANEDAG